ncbi:MAG: O-antigen polymerase, partial [Erysipelotrichales bacterium]|nr:O-antigen polymerase [Erysipelotrichales bacterium]
MVYLVFTFFVILFIIARSKYWKISSYLIAVYAFSVFFSIFLYNSSDPYYRHTSFIASIVFCVSLFLYFSPYFRKELFIESNNNSRFIRRFSIVGYIISITLLIGCILLFSKIMEVASFGLVEARHLAYTEDETLTSFTTLQHIGHSDLRWLSGLSYTMLIMFFYAMSFIKGKVFLKVLLFLSSLSATYLGITNGGRTRLIYWILFFIFTLILFRPYLSKRTKKIIFSVSVLFFSLIGLYFAYITFGRADVLGRTTGNFLIEYVGQPYLNFCNFYENFHYKHFTLYRIFPLTSYFISGLFDLTEYRDKVYAHSHMEINGFNTFIGDFYIDVGLLGIIVYSIVYFLIS